MSSEGRPQPRFRMWDKVAYRYCAHPVPYTVITVDWDEYNQDYEYCLARPEQKLGLAPEEYIYGSDGDDALYLVERTGMASQPKNLETTGGTRTEAPPPPVPIDVVDRDRYCNRTAGPSIAGIMETLAGIERKQRENEQLSKELIEVGRRLGRAEAELKHLQEENAWKREAIRLFGTLCPARKEDG